jgi:hypothetical protein
MTDLHFSVLGEDIAEFALSLSVRHSVDFEKVAWALVVFIQKLARATRQGKQADRFVVMALDAFRWRLQFDGYGRDLTLAEIIDTDVGSVEGGKALFVTYDLLTGERSGTRLRHRIDIFNEDAKIQAIGRYFLAVLFAESNTQPSNDSADLHSKRVFLRLDSDRVRKIVALDKALTT